MAQMTEALAHAILAGDGITRSEVEQLCHFFLRHSADLARLTAELERTQRECEGLRELERLCRELVAAYNEMPDGPIGRGLTNGHFLRIEAALPAGEK